MSLFAFKAQIWRSVVAHTGVSGFIIAIKSKKMWSEGI